jgi:RimJ/RimL family protein N-acetyltransferase
VKLNASCADKNEGSKKVLLKNNFKIEGIKKKHLFYNNEWMDQIDFGLLL